MSTVDELLLIEEMSNHRREVKEAQTILTDLACSEERANRTVEFNAIRAGVRALGVVERLPEMFADIENRYAEMINGNRTLSIAEYHDFVIAQLQSLVKESASKGE